MIICSFCHLMATSPSLFVLFLVSSNSNREQVSHLCDAHGILRSTADEVELPELPYLDGPVGLSSAAHRLIEGIAASLAGGSTQPLAERKEHRNTDEEELMVPMWLNGHPWHFHCLAFNKLSRSVVFWRHIWHLWLIEISERSKASWQSNIRLKASENQKLEKRKLIFFKPTTSNRENPVKVALSKSLLCSVFTCYSLVMRLFPFPRNLISCVTVL